MDVTRQNKKKGKCAGCEAKDGNGDRKRDKTDVEMRQYEKYRKQMGDRWKHEGVKEQ